MKEFQEVITITRYQCEFCKCEGTKEAIESHEEICLSNPEVIKSVKESGIVGASFKHIDAWGEHTFVRFELDERNGCICKQIIGYCKLLDFSPQHFKFDRDPYYTIESAERELRKYNDNDFSSLVKNYWQECTSEEYADALNILVNELHSIETANKEVTE